MNTRLKELRAKLKETRYTEMEAQTIRDFSQSAALHTADALRVAKKNHRRIIGLRQTLERKIERLEAP